MRTVSLFEGARMTQGEAMELTAQSLRAYGERYRHWAVAFSGGKDSSATVTAVAHLIAENRIPRPESLIVLMSDTRMELPPLMASALSILAECRRRGFRTQIVMPALDDRFFVYMFGRGVPPPKNRFRWCTPQLKVEPMLNALRSLREQAGEKILMLTGVRMGESAARDQRIVMSCSRDGAECGQGWFQETTPSAIADTLAPLLHWRICHVADWLGFGGMTTRDGFVEHGFPTRQVAEIYGQGEREGDAIELDGRTGCVGCNLASRDTALDRILRQPQWAYLQPFKRLKPLYAELTRPFNRLRKGMETRADGELVKNPGRLGPLTMEARRRGMLEVFRIQSEINLVAREQGRPEVSLINPDEAIRINELIAANTWPNRWTGEEEIGDVFTDRVMKDGLVQPIIAGLSVS
jgi:DNA sulfur modification protein DndC